MEMPLFLFVLLLFCYAGVFIHLVASFLPLSK